MHRAHADVDLARDMLHLGERFLLVRGQLKVMALHRRDVLAAALGKRRVKEVHLRRADEAGDEEVGRVVEDLLRRADLLDEAVAHDDDAVAQRHGLDLVMGDIDEGGVDLLAQLDDLRAHLVAELGVEVGELDLENQQTELDGHDSKTAEMQTLQAKLIQQHEQKKAAAAAEVTSKEPAAELVAKTEAEQEDPAAAETERRRQHEEAEAKRKAEWERQQAEKRTAEQAALAKIEQMSETELVKASMERMKKETERLTRRNLKECVSEYVQTLCLSDPAFARMVMHPRKSMAHCLQFINRKAREYLLAEMKDNGMEPQPNGIYGGDVPEDTCYDWAEEYFRDANAEEDEIKEEPFVPKPYPGAPVKSKRQPKKEKTKAETKTAKPEQVIQMPQPEKSPDEEQFSMFDLMGGMAG